MKYKDNNNMLYIRITFLYTGEIKIIYNINKKNLKNKLRYRKNWFKEPIYSIMLCRSNKNKDIIKNYYIMDKNLNHIKLHNIILNDKDIFYKNYTKIKLEKLLKNIS